MRTLFTLGFIIIFFLILPGIAVAGPVGKITKIEGRVDITSPDQKARTAYVGDELFQGDFVRTKSRSKAEILFSDGSTMRLAQSTRIEVSEYVVTQTKRSSIIKLFRGTVQSKVKKMFGRLFGSRSRNRYEIHTPTAVCGVRGTDYFSTYQDGTSHFLFKEGSGYGYNVNNPDEIKMVNAGQIMSIAGENQNPLVRQASDMEMQKLNQSTDIKDGQDGTGESGEDGEKGGVDDQQSKNGSGTEEGGKDLKADEAKSDEGGESNDVADEGLAENNEVEKNQETKENPAPAQADVEQQGNNENEAEGEANMQLASVQEAQPEGENNGDAPVTNARDDGPADRNTNEAQEPVNGESVSLEPEPGGSEPVLGEQGEAGPLDTDGGNQPVAEGPVGEAGPVGPSGVDNSGSLEPTVEPLDNVGASDPNLMPMDQDSESSNPMPLDNTVAASDNSPIPLNNPDDTVNSIPDYKPQDNLFPMPTEPVDTSTIDLLDPTVQDLIGPDPNLDVYIPPDNFEFVEPFTIDNFSIAGTPDGVGRYPLSVGGTYDWQPPFIHMGGEIQGNIEPGSGALSEAFYIGFMGANFHDESLDNIIKGGAMFLYMAQDGSAGVLMDDELNGVYDPVSSTWSAGTPLRPIEMAASGSINVPALWGYGLGLKFQEGGFYTTSGSITVDWSRGLITGFAGQDWGLWRTEAGGFFTDPTAYDWHIDLWDFDDNFPNSFFRYMQINGSDFLYGNLEGDVAGGWVNLNQVTTGVLSGTMHGGFDPNDPNNKWFAVSGGTWMETTKFLQMTQTTAGRNSLNDLGIPYIEVGRTDLTGNSDAMDVYMNNVTFFAYSTGGSPRIWATNSVTGYAITTPPIGHNVNLIGSGLNVDFIVQKWDNGVWGAELEGGGLYNNPGQSMNNKNILMKGGSTGQYQAGGSFSGTASGNATTTY